MTVRKATGTTISLIILIAGLAYLLPLAVNSLRYEVNSTIYGRMYLLDNFGGPYPFVVKAAIWSIIVSGILDAILRNKVALGLFSSLNIPIVMCIPVFIAAFIPPVNSYMFWAVLQLAVILGTYWAFRKTIRNNHSGGQKLIPFIKEIASAGGTPRGHASDHYVVWGASLFLLVVWFVSLIAFVVFVATNWNVLY